MPSQVYSTFRAHSISSSLIHGHELVEIVTMVKFNLFEAGTVLEIDVTFTVLEPDEVLELRSEKSPRSMRRSRQHSYGFALLMRRPW